jgi:hypothetical protein
VQNETIMKDMKFSSERGEGKGFPRSGKWEKERISHNNEEGRKEAKVHEKRSRIGSLQKGKEEQ